MFTLKTAVRHVKPKIVKAPISIILNSDLNTQAEQKTRWNNVLKEAERVVGYPTSFLSLRWILSDELANIASQLRKLIGINHPLLHTIKNLLVRNELPTWGLIVLLISKTAGLNANFSELECDRTADILHSQRILAEVTEMIKTSHLIHCGLINIEPETENASDLHFGNKIALLSGDYLLSNCCAELVKLKNQDLVELMSSALRDLSEAEFVGPRDKQNNPLPARPRPDIVEYKQFTGGKPLEVLEPSVVSEALGNARAEWTLRHVLNAGSLLGKSCQGTLKLAGHPLDLQEQGYLFGKHLALAWQACLDREPFLPSSTGSFSLVTAPVMFTLQHEPSLYDEIEKGVDTVDDIDYEAVRRAVIAGPGLEMTKSLQKDHSNSALEVLNELPASDARTALANIITAMQDL